MPTIRWPAVLAGVPLAVVLALLGAVTLPPISAAVASFFGLFVSGILAGILAKEGRAYHGALVGAGYVLCEALGLVPALSPTTDPLTDTVAVIASDALLLASAALGGWCSRLLSSSDRDTGR
jgi:hypothetical protein